ncbi:MAG: cell division FtsA domain-containing protein, partial [Patescibacteria group bacterium]
IIGIAGELVKGTKTTVHHSRSQPKTKIDLSELKEMIAKVQQRAFEETRSQLAAETGHDEIDVRLVHAAVVDVRIDGYRVSNPLGFQGREVEVGVFNVFAPIVHLGALQTIAEELDLDLLSIVAEPYAVARAQGAELGAEYSAIFIDIGGGTTDIAVVRNGGIEGTKMFALGGRAFTKRLGAVLGAGFAEAEQVKLDYSAGHLADEREAKVRKALADDAEVWLGGIELTLAEFANPRLADTGLDLLPGKILLCGGGSALPEISQLLKTKNWTKNLPFARQPSIHFLQPKDVERVIDETHQLKDPSDVTPMALANLAIELVGEEPVMEGILSKVVHGLRQ